MQGNPTGTRKTSDYFGLAGTEECETGTLLPRSLLFLPPILSAIRYYCPLTALTEKRIWHWGAVEQRAFEDLKESFLRHVVLAFPDRNKPYILYTDASDTGV